jgi:SAM-dependent methyltransferase
VSIPGADAVRQIVAALDCAGEPHLRVLEAGCGRYRHITYPDAVRITGLDITAEELAHNEYVHEKIVGDVQSWQTQRQWDVVVCLYLLEHVDDPERGVANLLQWTRPGGLLVIAVPNVFSLKGLVTRATPFGFHDWFYRHIYRQPYAIFPTTMKPAIAPDALRRQLAGHRVVLERYSQESFSGLFGVLYQVVCGLLKVLTLGRWRPEDSNYLLVMRVHPGNSIVARHSGSAWS